MPTQAGKITFYGGKVNTGGIAPGVSVAEARLGSPPARPGDCPFQGERGPAILYPALVSDVRGIRAGEALDQVSGPGIERSKELFRHGSLQVKIYAPVGTDPQTPHTRDEIYVVIRGSGTFVGAAGRREFGPGDFLFAPGRGGGPSGAGRD